VLRDNNKIPPPETAFRNRKIFIPLESDSGNCQDCQQKGYLGKYK